MKKKLSLGENKSIRTILVFAVIQALIIILFVRMLSISQPINICDTKQTSITVEDIYVISIPKECWLVIIADTERYIMESQKTFNEYSVNEIYESISVGDKVSLKYYEEYNIWGKAKMVVEARSETEVYRSIEEYNRAKQGVPVAVVVVFSMIELVFCGVVFVYVWLNYNTINVLFRRLKKRLFNV